jgi:hypothetical protein
MEPADDLQGDIYQQKNSARKNRVNCLEVFDTGRHFNSSKAFAEINVQSTRIPENPAMFSHEEIAPINS